MTAPRGPTTLLPIIAVVFVAYLVIGLAMPVLPLHVHDGLGMSTFVVGLVGGSQFAAALISRMFAGRHADSRGPRRALITGLSIATLAGLLNFVSLGFLGEPLTSVTILIAARLILGVAETFIITGALTWGLALMGLENTGKVMAWVGTALYAAFAIGAPVGTALYDSHGFAGIALATTLIPLAALPWVASRSSVVPPRRAHAGFTQVLGAVWVPGLCLALSGVGFGAVTTFIGLLFAEHGWTPAWLAFSALSIAFMAGRLLFGHLPDRHGGARVALVCMLLEAVGQTLIWRAPSSVVALLGVTLTGLGYSLVYPGLGVEALRRAPEESRGLAMAAYTAFLDLSLGVAGPALGLIAVAAGLGSVFLVSTLFILSATLILVRILGLRSTA